MAWVNGVSVLTFWASYLKNSLGFKRLFVHEMTWEHFQCETSSAPFYSWWLLPSHSYDGFILMDASFLGISLFPFTFVFVLRDRVSL